MLYATPGSLATYMGLLGGFTSEQEIRAQLLLEDASEVINEELGLAPGTSLHSAAEEVLLDGTGTPKLVLPRWPVTAVESVVEIDLLEQETELTHLVDYTWSASGVLTRFGRWPALDRSVRVNHTAGLDPIPGEIERICRRVASAGWQNPMGLDYEQLGSRAVKWNTPGMQLTSRERDTLAKYAR